MITKFTVPGESRFGLPAAPANSPAYFVRDEAECRALTAAVIRTMPRLANGVDASNAKANFEDHDLTYTRVGPYYAVLLAPRRSPTDKVILTGGYETLAIFRIVPSTHEPEDGEGKHGQQHDEHAQTEHHGQADPRSEHTSTNRTDTPNGGERTDAIQYVGSFLM